MWNRCQTFFLRCWGTLLFVSCGTVKKISATYIDKISGSIPKFSTNSTCSLDSFLQSLVSKKLCLKITSVVTFVKYVIGKKSNAVLISILDAIIQNKTKDSNLVWSIATKTSRLWNLELVLEGMIAKSYVLQDQILRTTRSYFQNH